MGRVGRVAGSSPLYMYKVTKVIIRRSQKAVVLEYGHTGTVINRAVEPPQHKAGWVTPPLYAIAG